MKMLVAAMSHKIVCDGTTDLEGSIGEARALAQAIDQSVNQPAARKKLLVRFLHMEKEKHLIEPSHQQLVHTEQWQQLLGHIGKPISEIETLWTRLEMEWATDSLEFNANCIERVWLSGYENLLKIHDAVMGTSGPTSSWLKVFASLTRSDTTANSYSSPSERVSQYLKTHILQVQLKGLALLRYSGLESGPAIISEWINKRFPAQGAVCQEVMDAMPTSSHWWGDMRTGGQNSPRSFTRISRDWVACPQGQAAVGFRFNMFDSILTLQLYSGKPDSHGRFFQRSETRSETTPNHFMVERSEEHFTFWNTNPIEAPDGFVLTGLCLAMKTHDHLAWESGPRLMGSYTYHLQEIYPVAEFRPLLSNGRVGSKVMVLEPPHPNLDHHPRDEAYFLANGLTPWEKVGLTGWAYPSGSAPAPCTGARFRLNDEGVVHCAARSHYHGQAVFKKAQTSGSLVSYWKHRF